MSHKDKQENEQIFDNVFKDQENPDAWAATARELHRAAEILFAAERDSRFEDGEPKNIEDMAMNVPATLLYGYAVENAIKARLIALQGYEKAVKENDRRWRRHRLYELAEKTGVSLNSDHLALLNTLTEFVRWAGKYPMSFERKDFTLPKQFAPAGGGEYLPPYPLRHEAVEILDALFDVLIKGL